jgi:hypothetical protein
VSSISTRPPPSLEPGRTVVSSSSPKRSADMQPGRACRRGGGPAQAMMGCTPANRRPCARRELGRIWPEPGFRPSPLFPFLSQQMLPCERQLRF